eukprot:SAG11_NODE_36883_length_259_cov_0.968750_1_plen_68_part_10
MSPSWVVLLLSVLLSVLLALLCARRHKNSRRAADADADADADFSDSGGWRPDHSLLANFGCVVKIAAS